MTHSNAYQEGRAERASGHSRNTCPYPLSDMQLRHWWFAGWHDRDMELAK